MDLLSSILDSMDKPPTASEQQKKLIKRQKEIAEKLKIKQKEELVRFRKYVDGRIERFSKDDRTFIEFQALDQLHRSIIHDVAEFGGFLPLSFGREEIDRYTVVYKKEHAPTEDEIYARRNGEGWNDEVANEYAERRKENELKRLAQAIAQTNGRGSSSSSTTTGNDDSVKPSSNYKHKYAHIIGEEAALEAARKTETNVSYGFVPSKNKKDMRSIEQTLADIQAKKRLRLAQQQQELEQAQQLEEQAVDKN